MPETKVPALPEPNTIKDPHLRRTLSAVKEALDIRLGRRGHPLDKAVTLRDLFENGIINVRNPNGGGNPFIEPMPPAGDFDIPPTPFGLDARGGFTSVVMKWDFVPYRSHAYTEIWRSTVDDLSTAAPVGASISRVYADVDVEYETTYYYWVRLVNRGGIAGPYNQTEGTPATTGIDIQKALEDLVAEIEGDELTMSLREQIELLNATYDIEGSVAWQIAAEAQARADEIAAEAQARAAAISDEAEARVSELQTEREQRLAAFDIFDGQIDDLVNGLNQEIQIRSEEDYWLGQQISIFNAAHESASAAVQTLNNVFVSETEALAQNLIQVQTSLEGKADSSAIFSLTSRVEDAEAQASAASNALVQLENSLFTEDGEVRLDVIGVLELDTRVETIEDNYLTSSSQLIVDLQSYVGLDEATAFSALTSRVTDNEGEISSVSEDITLLRNTLSDRVAETSAFTELSSQVTDIDGVASGAAQNVTLLEGRIEDAEGSILQEAQLRIEEDFFSSLIRNVQTAALGTNSAAITTNSQIELNETEVIVSDLTKLEGQVVDNRAEFTNFREIQVNENSARATELNSLRVEILGDDTRQGAIDEVKDLIIDEDGVSAISAETIAAVFDTANNQVSSEILAARSIVLSEDGFITSSVNALRGTYSGDMGNLKGDISGVQEVVGDSTGGLVKDVRALNLELFPNGDGDPVGVSAVDLIEGKLSNEGAVGKWIQQLSTTFDGNTAAIETQKNVVDGLNAQYTIKTDVAGLVSGFGLASSDASSRFTIAANRFVITAPTHNSPTAPSNPVPGMVWRNSNTGVVQYRRKNNTWNSSPDVYPFTFLATQQTVNGVDRQPGMYIDNAFIANGSITEFKLGTGIIDDVHIKDAAITNAKIDTIDAGKITTGLLAANRIDTNGLEIKDASGNVILRSGQSVGLGYQYVQGGPPANATSNVLHTGSSTPSNIVDGRLWYNTNHTPPKLQMYQNGNWFDVSTLNNERINQGTAHPSGGSHGDVYIKLRTGFPDEEYINAYGTWTKVATINDKITSSNVSTYIADLAVTNQQIGNVIRSTNFNGSETNPFTTPGSTGWCINKNGNVAFNNVHIRGTLTVGMASVSRTSFESYVVSHSGTGFTALNFIHIIPDLHVSDGDRSTVAQYALEIRGDTQTGEGGGPPLVEWRIQRNINASTSFTIASGRISDTEYAAVSGNVRIDQSGGSIQIQVRKVIGTGSVHCRNRFLNVMRFKA